MKEDADNSLQRSQKNTPDDKSGFTYIPSPKNELLDTYFVVR
jgi:hypothetical protein